MVGAHKPQGKYLLQMDYGGNAQVTKCVSALVSEREVTVVALEVTDTDRHGLHI